MSVSPRFLSVRRKALTAFGASALILASLSLSAAPVAAAPGSPGVPSDPTVVYNETFENTLADVDSEALRDYTGADGTTFTGTDYWTEPAMCNGILISRVAPDAIGCGPAASSNHLRRMANVLGQVNGGTAAGSDGNHAVSAYTNSPDVAHPLAADDIEFATETPIALTAGSHFLTFSVDAASINCHAGGAQLSFFLDDGAAELAATNTPINVCTDARASTYSLSGSSYVAGRFISDSSVLFSGASLGIVMRNGYGSAAGNDHAYDNIRVLDATPQLDKSFETKADPWITGEPADLTFTVTNTSELAEKTGWGLVDTLPAGLTVAGAGTTTCAAANITAVTGAGTITIAGGSIASGVASCTVTVPVSASAAGSFTNGPGNVTTTGLKDPGPSTITYEAPNPELELTKKADLADTNGNGAADIGEQITFTFDVKNSGNVDVDDVAIDDAFLKGAGLAVTPATQDIARTDTKSFTSDPYVVTQDDIDAGGVANVATANGKYGNDPVVSKQADTKTPGPVRDPELTVVKNAKLNDKNGNNVADKGEKITYSFIVTNSGNVTVLDVSVSDDKVTGLDPASVAALLPGDKVLFTADPYVVTAEDIENGSVDNSAVAEGHTVDNADVVSDPDTVSVDTADPVAEAGLLPDTGGPLIGFGAFGAALLAAGMTIVMRRRRAGSHIA